MFRQQRSQPNYCCQLLTLAAILTLVAAGGGKPGRPGARIKGSRSLGSQERYSSVTNGSRRLHKNKGKKTKFGGPNQRSCITSAKRNEVKFECETRAGDSFSLDNSRDSKSAKKSSKSSYSSSRSSDGADGVDEDYASYYDEAERQDRGISIVPDPDLIKDKIKYKIKTTDDGISVKLEYENEVEMEITETETKTKFELLFYEIVEYVKKSNDDPDAEEDETEAYEWNKDEIVQSLPLTDWMDIPSIVNADDGIVSYFTATTASLGMEGGTVAFNFTISRADLDRGQSVTANSMKIDVLIKDFPWSRQDSYVTLLSTLESEKKVKVEYEKEATAGEGGKGKGKKAKDVLISFGGEDTMESAFGFSTYGEYTWVNEAEVTPSTTNADGFELSQTEDSGSGFSGTVVTGRQGSDNGDPSSAIIPVQLPTTLLEEEVENNSTSATVEVVATSPADDEDEDSNSVRYIAYSFVGAAAQGASDIYWDPQAGIGYQSSSSSSQGVARHSGFIAAGTMLISLLLSLSAWA